MATKHIRLILLFGLSALAIYYGSAFALSAQAQSAEVSLAGSSGKSSVDKQPSMADLFGTSFSAQQENEKKASLSKIPVQHLSQPSLTQLFGTGDPFEADNKKKQEAALTADVQPTGFLTTDRQPVNFPATNVQPTGFNE